MSAVPSSADLPDFLTQTQIFQGLSKTHLNAIARIARSKSYHKAETIFHQGELGNGFYIVQSGRVKVFQLSAGGREQILHVFSSGDHFAEVAALDGKAFPASAAAIEKSELLFFPRQRFLTQLEKDPTLAINLLSSFAHHLRHFSRLVDNLSLREVPGRLAAHLLQLSHQTGKTQQVTLSLNKRQLSAVLGTVPETLSRVLYRLSQEGVIAVEGNQVTLLDFDRLRNLAQ